MAGVVDHHEFAARPCLTQVPGHVERRAEVYAPVDKDCCYPRQAANVTQKGAILEERCVVPVMGDESGERHPKAGVVVARVGSMIGPHDYVGVLPAAPVASGLLPHGGI